MESPDPDQPYAMNVESSSEQPPTLAERTCLYFANNPKHLAEVKGKIPQELLDKVRIVIRDEKIKKVFFPLLLSEAQNLRSLVYRGVCGLEGVGDKGQIISVGCDGLVTLCPEKRSTECDVVSTESHPYSACLQRSNLRLFMGGLGGRITTVDTNERAVLQDAVVHDSTIGSLAISHDEKFLAAGSHDGLIQILNADSLRHTVQLDGHRQAIRNTAFTEESRKLISASSDGVANQWDISVQKAIAAYKLGKGRLIKMILLGDENNFVSACDGNALLFGDMRESKIHKSLHAGCGAVSTLLASKDGQRLVSGSWNGLAKVWDIRMLRRAATIFAHKDWVQSLSALDDNLNKIVTGSRDSTVKIWNINPLNALENLSFDHTLTLAKVIAKSPKQSDEEKWALLKLFVPS